MNLTAVIYPDRDSDWLVAHNPETGATTQGKTFDEALANLKEATELFLSEFPLKAIWQSLSPPNAFKNPNARPVAMSDGRLFLSGAEAAKAIGVAPEMIYSAAKRKNGTCKGYGVAAISLEQEEMFRRNPDLLDEFWRNRLPPFPYRKPNS